jgi:hypothetical protein
MQQAAGRRCRKHGNGIRCAGRAQIRAFERIDGDVDLRKRARGTALERMGHANLFADEQHRRLVALAFANNDRPVDRHRVHGAAHCFDRGLVRSVTIALPHRVCARNGRLLDHAQELE